LYHGFGRLAKGGEVEIENDFEDEAAYGSSEIARGKRLAPQLPG
jgi:hypothetical protein